MSNVTAFSVIGDVTNESIRDSARRINDEIHCTPVMTSRELNQKASGRKLFFKCEHLQRTGSFKVRGALSALTKLLETETVQPTDIKLVTSSSGNFGLGLSYAARCTGIKDCTVLMAMGSSPLKETLVRSYGAKIQHYTTLKEKDSMLASIIKETNALYIASSETLDVISGQGTVGLELMNQIPDLDAIVVPVGGGGIISGIATIAKSINPNIKIIGAEPTLSNSCELSLREDSLCQLKCMEKTYSTMADGLRVSIGPNTWPIIRKYVDDIVSVSEDEIKSATLLLWHYLKQLVEPNAGVALAAILSSKFAAVSGDVNKIGVILTGGNVSPEFMRDICDQSSKQEHLVSNGH